jgi:hypothetical protein
MTKGFRIYQIAQVYFVPLGQLLPQAKQVLQIMEKVLFYLAKHRRFSVLVFTSHLKETLLYRSNIFMTKKIRSPNTGTFGTMKCFHT